MTLNHDEYSQLGPKKTLGYPSLERDIKELFYKDHNIAQLFVGMTSTS